MSLQLLTPFTRCNFSAFPLFLIWPDAYLALACQLASSVGQDVRAGLSSSESVEQTGQPALCSLPYLYRPMFALLECSLSAAQLSGGVLCST